MSVNLGIEVDIETVNQKDPSIPYLDRKRLNIISEVMDFDYLGNAPEFPRSFPSSGIIWSPNHRLMIGLPCRSIHANKPINVLFMVDTGSPYTYLSTDVCQALTETKANDILEPIYVNIQSTRPFKIYRSTHANVLGVDFLVENNLSIMIDYRRKTFQLK